MYVSLLPQKAKREFPYDTAIIFLVISKELKTWTQIFVFNWFFEGEVRGERERESCFST